MPVLGALLEDATASTEAEGVSVAEFIGRATVASLPAAETESGRRASHYKVSCPERHGDRERLSLAVVVLAAGMAVSGCAGFWRALEAGDSTEDIYCDKRRAGYQVTDGKRTEIYRLNCPAWVDGIMETRERAKARGWKEDE